MNSVATQRQTSKQTETRHLFQEQFPCSCGQAVSINQSLEDAYCEITSSSYNFNSNQIIPKNAQIQQFQNNDSHIHQNAHSLTSKQICFNHTQDAELIQKMERDLLLNEEYKIQFHQQIAARSQFFVNPVCGLSLKEIISYHCFDCFQDRKATICEACFENSDHYGHRYYSQKENAGICDCGDQEVMHQNAKVGCCMHKGNANNDDIDLQKLDQQFLMRAKKLIPEWFKIVFNSVENSLMNTEEQQFIDLQNKMITCIIKVIQKLGFKNDVFLQKAISDILISHSNKYLLYHDCNDYQNKIPVSHTVEKKECSCNILELIFRFSMLPCFSHETQGLMRQFFTEFFSVQSYKVAYAQAFIKNFQFLFDIDLKTPNKEYQEYSNNLICLTRQEVFSSFVLNQAIYATGQVRQIFLNYLKIARFFNQQKSNGDCQSKILPYQFFYYHTVNITSLIQKEELFEKFLQEEELFDIILQVQSQLQGLISFDHKIYMPEHNHIDKNTYLLFYRLTGQLNLFKIISNNFIPKMNQEYFHDKLISFIKKTLQSIYNYYNDNPNQKESQDKISTCLPLERAFIYLFFAFFQFDLKNVTQSNLQNLQKHLGFDDQRMKKELNFILTKIIKPISLYQEVQNKMWVFNGEELESFLKQYTSPDFELKVLDTMFVKIMTKLYSYENIIEHIPQNDFTQKLVELRQQDLIDHYEQKELKIYENAQNMVQKSFTSFACFLNFVSYNVCSELDEIYFKCIQNCQNQIEVGENIIQQATTYFATLFNGLSKTMQDIKGLGEIYQQDLGKRAPVQKMYQKVSKIEQNYSVIILKSYENIFEPYNFAFNFDAQSKYYGAIEVNQNIEERVVMILGNVSINKEEYKDIGRNTVNRELIKYLIKFFNSEYNLKVIREHIQIKEKILYSILKLVTIFIQVQACTNENYTLIQDFLNLIQNTMPEKQFVPFIQHVMSAMQKNYASLQQNENTEIIQNDMCIEVEHQENNQTEQAANQKKKAQELRKQQLLKEMEDRQNKAKAKYLTESNNNAQSIEEECCYCKQPLSNSAFGILVSIQNNNFYQDQELKTIKSNLKSSKNNQISENIFEEIKSFFYEQEKNLPDTFIFNTCDHKIHKECFEQNLKNTQLNQYEQTSREFEAKCQICKQYKNFFFEIYNNNEFEEEKFGNQRQNNSDMDIFNNNHQSMFNTSFSMFDHSAHNLYDMNNYGMGGGFDNNDMMIHNNFNNSDPFDFEFDSHEKQKNRGHNHNNNNDEEEVREIIYKKVKRNNNEAQFKEAQNHSFSRINKIYSQLLTEKAKLREFSSLLKSQLNILSTKVVQDEKQQVQQQKNISEFRVATEIFEKFTKQNQLKSTGNPYNFGQIVQKSTDQFYFYERCLYNQIKYFDLANKRPDDDSTILKMVPFLFQCALNSFSLIDDQEFRHQVIEKRFKYCKYFEEMIQKGSISKFDQDVVKDLPYILKQNIFENNLIDAYTIYLIFQLNFQFQSDQDGNIKTTLANTLKKLSLQVIQSQSCLLKVIHKYQLDNEDDIEDLSCFLQRLTRRALVTTILHQKYRQQSSSFDKVFANTSKFESEHQIILKYFKLNTLECLPSQVEIDSLENQQSSNTKSLKAQLFSSLTISTSDSFSFEIISIPSDYLEYSKTIYKKKCSLCNKMPLIVDLMQCLICGDLICAQSCTQAIRATVGNLNRHANICHGGHSIYINTHNGNIAVISSPHSTLLVSTFLFQNSLKEYLRKQIKCEWKSFQLIKSIVQHMKKQLYENNTRNLIMEDHQQRQERNINPLYIIPNFL